MRRLHRPPPQCLRCWIVLPDDKKTTEEAHLVQTPICDLVTPRQPKEGISNEQLDKFKELKHQKAKSMRDMFDEYHLLWKVIFPNDPFPLNSKS
jgi:hypothetical protein